jgi:hypothetical protein
MQLSTYNRKELHTNVDADIDRLWNFQYNTLNAERQKYEGLRTQVNRIQHSVATHDDYATESKTHITKLYACTESHSTQLRSITRATAQATHCANTALQELRRHHRGDDHSSTLTDFVDDSQDSPMHTEHDLVPYNVPLHQHSDVESETSSKRLCVELVDNTLANEPSPTIQSLTPYEPSKKATKLKPRIVRPKRRSKAASFNQKDDPATNSLVF